MKNSNFYNRVLSTVLLFLMTFIFGYSQNKIDQKIQDILKDKKVQSVEIAPERGTPHTIRFDAKTSDGYALRNTRQVLKQHLQLKSYDLLKPVGHTKHINGIQVARYQQYYKQIKVEHGKYNALAKADRLSALSGEFYEIKDIDITPSISEGQALESAKKYIGASEYVWEYVESLWRGMFAPEIAEQINQAYGEYLPAGELVIVDDYSTPEVDLDLAWKFNIYANEPLSRDWVYINAHDGRIMLKDAIIKHANASVATRYSGTKNIETTFMEGTNPNQVDYPGGVDYYLLLDQTRGNGIQTYDMNGIGGAPISVPLLYSLATNFVDDNNIWQTSEHVRDPAPTQEEAINDDIAWDAHWGAEMVYDYWLEVHGRHSYDDNDAKINSYVHYGEGYDNAFWNGTAMTYGDGSFKDFGGGLYNGSFSPLTSMDVCAHEIGHAVCSNTADLVYQRESGAMNEGFSDIWAACLENYVAQRFSNESFDYKPWGIGEQIDQRSGPGNLNRALRWMDNPKAAGDPDTYGGTNWTNPECGEPTLANDYCGVHSNSGVLNKWFYLMTVGSGTAPDDGVNDKGNTYSVSGLGFEVSELIAFGTEVQLSPNATFAQARAASITYARLEYGPCSAQEEAVTNAWFAVGVGPAFSCESGPVTTGFLVTQEAVNEAADGPGFCDDSKTHVVSLFMNAADTFNLVVGGTATQGADYELVSSTIAYAGNGFSVQNVTITIFDDASQESDETIVLSLPASVPSVPGSDVYTLTIRDDDVAPVVGIGDKSLLYERFLTTSMPAGWGQLETLTSLNTWHFGSYQGRAYISATGLLPVYEGENNQTDITLYTPLLDARGLENVTVSFDWTAGGETDVAIGGGAPFDFARLTYSFDGVKFFDIDPVMVGDNFGTTPASDTYSGDISHIVGNRQFYLGWRWINDPLVGTAYSFSFDNVRVNASTRQVESDLHDAGEEHLGPFATVYYFSADDGELLASITNHTGHDFGCTSLSVERAGSGTNYWYNGGKSTKKAIRISPEFNSASANVDISLYYSEEEISGYETGSGTPRQLLNMFNTTAATIGAATASNSTESNAAYVAIHKTPSTVIAGKFTANIIGELGGVVLARETGPQLTMAPPSNSSSVSEMMVYPNPASIKTTLILPALEEEQMVSIFVRNLNGQVVTQERITAVGNDRITLDVAQLTAGIYFIDVQSKYERFTKKLLIE